MERRNPGAVSTLVRAWKKSLKTGVVNVPCESCTACCRSIAIQLTDSEAPQYAHERTEADGLVLKKQANGDCHYLIDNKCSIYEQRPQACRVYDCRFRLLIGLMHDEHPAMVEALDQWLPIRVATAEDKAILKEAKRQADEHKGESKWQLVLP